MSKDSSGTERPTRVRYGVLAFACVLSMVTYLDRVCFGSAGSDIVHDLGLTNTADLDLAFSAFALSYAVFEVPTGWLGDMFGPRKTLIRIVLWWSLFTALTGVVALGFVRGSTSSVWALTFPFPFIQFAWPPITVARLSLALITLICIRFLFGVGEAGAYPNITRALHNWFPFGERGFTQGMVWMSGRLMGGLTPIVWGLLVAGLATTATLKDQSVSLKGGDSLTLKKGRQITQADGTQVTLAEDRRITLAADQAVEATSGAKLDLADGESIEIDPKDKYTQLYFPALLPSWRWAFWMFGLLGVVWCVLFAMWFRNRPSEKPSVNEAERVLIEGKGGHAHASHSGVPWLKLMTNSNLWILCFMYFCAAYGWYINITYLPSFLEEQYGVEKTSLVGMVYKGGPLLIGAVGCLAGGFFTDWFIRQTGNQRMGRRVMGLFGHFLCAMCMFACVFTPTAFLFFLANSMGAFFNDLTMGSSWSTCQDIGRKYAAIVAGCMNTIGNLGGFVAAIATGQVLKAWQASHSETLGKAIKDLTPGELAAANLPAYQICFISFGVAYLLATACWFLIDSTKPVVPDDEHK